MKIETIITGPVATLRASGRLDSTWADHLYRAISELIREGRHAVRLHAGEIDYISSAGIRVLLRSHHELAALRGSFGLIAASPFVRSTLEMSGLGVLLMTAELETEVEGGGSTALPTEGICTECHELERGGRIQVYAGHAWQPWQPVQPEMLVELEFPRHVFGLGIGAPDPDPEQARVRLGEFVAVAGHLGWLPGDGADTPDYIEEAERFVPRLRAIQFLRGEGSFSHLLRFHPSGRGDNLTLSGLVQQAFTETGAGTVALVALAEIDGLVGVSLARSPGHIQPGDQPGAFPEIRNWLAFCGERLHRQQQALVVAFASRSADHPLYRLLPPASSPELRLHAHALVLPYRSLQQGRLDLAAAVASAFDENEPVNLMHLIEDDRPLVGLGESSFSRGAVWCAPVAEVMV